MTSSRLWVMLEGGPGRRLTPPWRREERQAEAVCGTSASSKVEPCQHLQKPKLSLRHPVRLISQLATSASALKSSHQPAPYLSIYSLFKPVRLSSAIQIKRPSGRECRANCRCSIFKVGFGPESSLGLEATTVSVPPLNASITRLNTLSLPFRSQIRTFIQSQ